MKRFFPVIIFVLSMAVASGLAQLRTDSAPKKPANSDPMGKSFVQAQADKSGKTSKTPPDKNLDRNPDKKKTTPAPAPKSFRAQDENAQQPADTSQFKPEASAGASPDSPAREQTSPEFPPSAGPRRGPGGGFPPDFRPPDGRPPRMRGEGMPAGPGFDGPRGMRPMGPPFPPPFLNRLRELPPEEQEKVLKNNQRFQSLPREQQDRMLERWRRFIAMSPEQREMIEKRFNNFNRLTPEQQQKAREMVPRWQNLAPERRRAMLGEFRKLRGMPPDERERYLDSKDLESRFSPDEREMLKQLGAFAPPFPPRFRPRGEGFPPGQPPEPPPDPRDPRTPESR